MSKLWKLSAFMAASTVLTSSVWAQDGGECSAKITRSNVIPCALSASLAVRAEQQTRTALEGRRTAVNPVLPSNPMVALTGAQRQATAEPTSINWSATLSQEIEIAGQRGSRLRAADADVGAQEKRILLTKRETAALAWSSFFEVVAAREQQRLAERLVATSQRMAEVTRARADKGLAASIDADVADAATLRVLQIKLEADRSVIAATANMDFLLGRDPSSGVVAVEGELTALAGLPDTASTSSLTNRPEILVLDGARTANLARAEAFRRSRIPSPTLSVFAQNDGFNERVFGLGLSFPIPLPQPVGRTYAGEIAEAEALAQRAEIEKTNAERLLRLQITTAYAAFTQHRKAVDALPADKIRRAEDSLRDLGQEIEAGRLNVRDAVVAQQALIELLQSNISERRALCLASVDLARALGVPLEEGAR